MVVRSGPGGVLVRARGRVGAWARRTVPASVQKTTITTPTSNDGTPSRSTSFTADKMLRRWPEGSLSSGSNCVCATARPTRSFGIEKRKRRKGVAQGQVRAAAQQRVIAHPESPGPGQKPKPKHSALTSARPIMMVGSALAALKLEGPARVNTRLGGPV
jgi:hypothetical protein